MIQEMNLKPSELTSESFSAIIGNGLIKEYVAKYATEIESKLPTGDNAPSIPCVTLEISDGTRVDTGITIEEFAVMNASGSVEHEEKDVQPEENNETVEEFISKLPEGSLSSIIANDKKYVVMDQLMNMKGVLNEIQGTRDAMQSKLKTQTSDPNIEIVESRLASIELETLKALDLKKDNDLELLKSIIEIEGQTVEVSINIDESKKMQFFKDFVIYLKTTMVETAKMDAAEAKFNEDMDKLMEESKDILDIDVKEKLNSFDATEYQHEYFNGLLAREDLKPETRVQIESIVASQKAGVTLDFLYDTIKDQIDVKKSSKSILAGFNTNLLGMSMQCQKILDTRFAKYKIRFNVPKFYDIEKKFFPEYEKYNNLFMYLIFRHIKHNYEKFTKLDIVSIIEMLVNIQWLSRPLESQPPRIVELRESMRRIYAMIDNANR